MGFEEHHLDLLGVIQAPLSTRYWRHFPAVNVIEGRPCWRSARD
jgi:hypothetical protein